MARSNACTVPLPPAYSLNVQATPTPLPNRPLRRRQNTRFRKTHVSANRPPHQRRSRLAANRRVVLLGPFGEPLTTPTGVGLELPFRFSTKYQDAETGLLYYGYRYYDPITGRWLSRDPIGELKEPNLFAYVVNNPLNFVDPFGLELKDYTTDTATIPVVAGYTDPGFDGQTLPTWTSIIANVNAKIANFYEVKIDGRLEIEIHYDANVVANPQTRPAAGGGTLADHEHGHAEIYKKWWTALKAEVDQFELNWCSKVCADAAAAYANQATNYYYRSAMLENAQYDQKRCPAQFQVYISRKVAAEQNALNIAKQKFDEAQKAWEATKCSKKTE